LATKNDNYPKIIQSATEPAKIRIPDIIDNPLLKFTPQLLSSDPRSC